MFKTLIVFLEVRRLTVQQLLLEPVDCVIAYQGRKNVGGPASGTLGSQLHHVILQNLPHRGTVALGKGIVQAHCSVKPVDLQELQATLSHNAS